MKFLSKGLFLSAIVSVSFLLSGIVFAHSPGGSEQNDGSCDELQLIFVVDQSGSMSGEGSEKPPSDPDGLRFFGPSAAVDALSALRYQTYQTATIRVAMVNFGTQASVGLDWTELDASTEADHQQLMQDLSPSFLPISSLGNTNPLAALQFASSLFARVPPKAGECPVRAVIVLTDGAPFVETEGFDPFAYMQELQNYVQQFMSPATHSIYVIGVDVEDNFWERYKPEWEEVTDDPNKVVRANNQAEMASLIIGFAEEAARKLAVTGSEANVECVAGGSLAIPPFVQQIRLTLIKPAMDTHLEVFDASGLRVEPGRSDMTVSIEGFNDPIESLTVKNPQPGFWDLRTRLPADAKDRCQVRLISFDATGKVINPTENATLTQFKRAPIVFSVADSASGAPLPAYNDPRYNLNTEAKLVGSGNLEQVLSLNAQSDRQEYTGEVIPLVAGSNALYVKAVTQHPDGSDMIVFDKPLAAIPVRGVQFALIDGPEGPIKQYQDVSFKFAPIATNQMPITLDLPLTVSATVTHDGETSSLTLEAAADDTYQVMFRPEKAGRYTINYQAAVEAPPPHGSISLEPGQTSFEATPVKLVNAQIIKPSGENFVATDALFRPTGLELQVQLVEEDGTEVGPGEIGAANPTAPIQVRILNEEFSEVGTDLRLNPTGKAGLFRLADNDLGPGEYQIEMIPNSDLGPDYTWSPTFGSKILRGQVNPIAYAVVVAGLGLVAVAGVMAVGVVRTTRHPLSGYIRIYEKEVYESALEGSTTREKTCIRESLPGRNRAVIRPGGWLPGLGGSSSCSHIQKVIVTSPNEEYSTKQRAKVTVKMRGMPDKSFELGPTNPPYPLGLGFFIEKGPRPTTFSYDEPVPDDFLSSSGSY